jgi:catechol 2,3-dioxygenase-like lactoylglutathione lyase family enzyme
MNTTPSFRIKKMSPQFLVTDLERSIEFYTKMLGFDIDFRYEDFYVGIVKDGCSIHLKSGKPYVEERKGKRKNENLDIIFSVDDIEDLYREFSGKGCEFVQPLREMPYGKEFYIADLDGYVIGFLTGV